MDQNKERSLTGEEERRVVEGGSGKGMKKEERWGVVRGEGERWEEERWGGGGGEGRKQ